MIMLVMGMSVASQAATITVGSASGSPGEQVSIPITIDSTAGRLDCSFSVSFDNTKLEYAGKSAGTMNASLMTASIPDINAAGKVQPIVQFEEGGATSGTIASFKFDIKSGVAAGDTDLTIGDITPSGTYTGVSGSVTIIVECTGPTITVGTADACESGALVEIPIDISDTAGRLDCSFSISFDNTKLQYTGKSSGDMNATVMTASLDDINAAGKVQPIVQFEEGGATSGIICYFKFTLLSAIPDGSQVDLTIGDLSPSGTYCGESGFVGCGVHLCAVAISPASAIVNSGACRTFTSTTTGTDCTAGDYTYSVTTNIGSTITQQGVYCAGTTTTTVTDTVKSTDTANGNVYDTALVTVIPCTRISISVALDSASDLTELGQDDEAVLVATVTDNCEVAVSGATMTFADEAGNSTIDIFPLAILNASGQATTTLNVTATGEDSLMVMVHMEDGTMSTTISEITVVPANTAIATITGESTSGGIYTSTVNLLSAGATTLTVTAKVDSAAASGYLLIDLVTGSNASLTVGNLTNSAGQAAALIKAVGCGDTETITATATIDSLTNSETVDATVECPCTVVITPLTATVESGECITFTATTTGEGCNEGCYTWSIETEIGSTITPKGQCGKEAEYCAGSTDTIATDKITVTDTANGNITATRTVVVTPKVCDYDLTVEPSEGQQGQTIKVTLSTEDKIFKGVPKDEITVDFGEGITATIKDKSENSLKVEIAIAANASAGERDVIVTLPDETCAKGSFTVTTGPNIVIIPFTGSQGETLENMTITGINTNFAKDKTKVKFGNNIDVKKKTIVDKNTITLKIKVSKKAETGARTVTVTTNLGNEMKEVAAGTFTVLPAIGEE